MRVAFLVSHFPVLSETFILNQITGLIDRGHDVDIYTSKYCDAAKLHPDVEQYQLLRRTYCLPHEPRHPIARVLKGIGLFAAHVWQHPGAMLDALNVLKYGSMAASFWLVYTAIPLLNREPYDIIHCQFGTMGARGRLMHRLGGGARLIVTFRGFDISSYLRQQGEQIYAPLFADADFFLTNCDFFKQRLLKLGCDRSKIAVHYSGIDCDRFRFTPRRFPADGIVRIACTGRLVEKKGIEYSIRAVAQAAEFYPQIEFQIIGEGELREPLQQLIDHLGIHDRVHLVGEKNQREIIEILDRCHLFIAPSVTAQDGNQDAPINVLKEAMAMGLPVVSTLHGGIPELVEDGVSGFLVPERDADALAARLRELIEHPARWAVMGRAGRDRVEQRFNLNLLNDELVALYQRLLGAEPNGQSMRSSSPKEGNRPYPCDFHFALTLFQERPMITSTHPAQPHADHAASEPLVTIVVVPRERFSYTRESLESIYEHTDAPFKLVYVDGNSPRKVRRYLEEQAQQRGFQLIRTNEYLSPNRARNIGVRQVDTKYLIFIDNDVIVAPGWLQSLVDCAEATAATIVGPLVCQNQPVHEIIHCAGGETHVWIDNTGDRPRRRLRERMYKQGKRVQDLYSQFQRQQTELAEFHCTLVRTEIFDRVGLLDEAMLNTKEHLDFCMTVMQAGGTVYFEPKCIVTYVPGPPLAWTDIPYYMLRWSDAWQLNSLHRLRDKWNLAEDGYFQSKYKKIGWRRKLTIILPLNRRLTLGLSDRLFNPILYPLDRLINQFLTDRYAKRQSQPRQTAVESAPGSPLANSH
jgi:colanic acid/amylovoran biosynthesis glycosyltransferase